MHASLIIPCYNEAAGLETLVAACRTAELPSNVEVVLVDNGSTDTTPDVLAALLEKDPQIRAIRVEENQGYGFGILAGLKAAKGDILGWTHADLQTDPADMKAALAYFKTTPAEGEPLSAFVKGSRFGRPLADVFFTIGMSFFEMLLLRRLFWDINAQPTVFSRDFFDTWEDPPHDFSLDLYAYYMAKKTGLKISRFPVYFGERQFGTSHWNIDLRSKYKFIRRTIDFSLELKKRYR
jgi:glycosyltransferase involved in cell wall biosynthesis